MYRVINKLIITFDSRIPNTYKSQIIKDITNIDLNVRLDKDMKWKLLIVGESKNIFCLSSEEGLKDLGMKTKELIHKALLYNVIFNKDYVNYTNKSSDLIPLDKSRRHKYHIEFTVGNSSDKLSSFVIEE